MIDLDLLVAPVSDQDPCGPDLDAEGDLDYLNFFASASTSLPMSYFEIKDGSGEVKRFDPNSINLAAQMEAAKPFLARTRDLRLIVYLAKISVLGRDLAAFTVCLEAIARLLEQYWPDVHPRAEDDDFSHRQYAIEAINVLPTVIIPLQFQPLVVNRRYGPISYRMWLIAQGEIVARDDDTVVDASAIEQVFNQADLDEIRAAAASFAAPAAAIARIRKAWNAGSGSALSLDLDRLAGTVDGIADLLGTVVRRRDPAAAEIASTRAEELGEGVASVSGVLPATQRMSSRADAAAALDAVAGYFRRAEPSSPALLLICQARQLLGKSFVEAIRLLVPGHADTATINIGRDRFFDLPIERMASLLEGDALSDTLAGVSEVEFVIETRAQALGLLEQIAAYFRNVEPTSAVPFLIDRGRELAQRDFLSLLRDVLPDGVLKTLDSQG